LESDQLRVGTRKDAPVPVVLKDYPTATDTHGREGARLSA
jgi:hypothetical protein